MVKKANLVFLDKSSTVKLRSEQFSALSSGFWDTSSVVRLLSWQNRPVRAVAPDTFSAVSSLMSQCRLLNAVKPDTFNDPVNPCPLILRVKIRLSEALLDQIDLESFCQLSGGSSPAVHGSHFKPLLAIMLLMTAISPALYVPDGDGPEASAAVANATLTTSSRITPPHQILPFRVFHDWFLLLIWLLMDKL